MALEMKTGTRYIIGIDLGTTNSAISYVDLNKLTSASDKPQKPPIHIYHIAQLTGVGEVSRLPVLPSFFYIPGPFDINQETISVPWSGTNTPSHFVGAFARDHGIKVPARLVSSAKSWLCHPRVDREARILPWGTTGEVQKVSPVDVTAAYLDHIRRAWNHAQGDDAEAYLENQQVILTVPASFDEVARDLTVKAAQKAGFGPVTLIEEPLAAFYSWLMRHEKTWDRFVQPGELILVCDVGGGTTDFTLITLRSTDGSPRFERIAVGDHLILGGDNIDLALARQVESLFPGSRQNLTTDRWKALCHQCRQAKELILGQGSDAETITLMGSGSRLIGGTLTAKLTREALIRTVLDGFFPLVSREDTAVLPDRKGITEFGLPYESDPAITRHLGLFVTRHRETIRQAIGEEHPAPDLVLFNGGSLKPAIIQDRIREAVRTFFSISDEQKPRVLENPDPDLAVSLGAAYYGLVKSGIGVRVGSGSPRAYYVGVAAGAPDSEDNREMAVCLVERGLDEGSAIALEDKKFEVLANQPVRFPIYSSSFRSGDKCGDLVGVDETLTALPPIQTVIQYGKKGTQARLPVQIEADYTEIGTLALWCRAVQSSHRWRLQFQLRSDVDPLSVSESAILDDAVVASAKTLLMQRFQAGTDARELESLPKDLAAELDIARDKWPLGLIRALSDVLIPMEVTRRIGPEHEARWYNLLGFTLRPGVGDGFDAHRVDRIWKFYPKGVVHSNQAQVRAEWWILWRRLAAGMRAGQQRQFFQDTAPQLIAKKGTKTRIPAQEQLEMWMALANMEQLTTKDKVYLGRTLVSQLKPRESKPQHFWALSRIGARELLYGSADRVVPASEVSQWMNALMSKEWRNPRPVVAALCQLARKTGDRARDLPDEMTSKVLDWMKTNEAEPNQLAFLTTVVPWSGTEQSTVFGEALPAGLVFHGEA
jgi:molecular chaperone DnaK (HSP70)